MFLNSVYRSSLNMGDGHSCVCATICMVHNIRAAHLGAGWIVLKPGIHFNGLMLPEPYMFMHSG